MTGDPAPRDKPKNLISALETFSVPPSGQALFSAVKQLDLEGLRQLLEAHADPNAVDDSGETPLFEAAISGHVTIVATLLCFGGNSSHKSKDGVLARELTNNRSIMTLMDLFLHKEVSTLDREKALAKLSPRTAGDVEKRLEPMRKPSSLLDRPEGPPEILDMELSGFYQEDQPPSPRPAVPERRQHFTRPLSAEPHVQAPVPSAQELLAETKEVFEVVKAKRCKVFSAPDLQATVLTSKSRGACFYGVELTMNGWLKLQDQRDGWMLVDMRGVDGLRQVLRPKKCLNVVVKPHQLQGLCMLEVNIAELCAHSTPREDSEVLHSYFSGEMLFGRSQNFSGWVRLVGDEGWVCARTSTGKRALQLIEAVDEIDLWALADLWATARRATKDPLSPRMIDALKELQVDSLNSTIAKLAQCRPGCKDDYFALGLSAQDMKQPRIKITRQLFVLILHSLLEDRRLFENRPTLFSYERAPQLRELAGVVECETEDGVKLYDLGSDSTVYDLETGHVFGMWKEETKQIVPMAHMSEFYRSAPMEAQPERGEDLALLHPQAEEEEDTQNPEDLARSKGRPTVVRDSAQDLMLRASDLVAGHFFEEALCLLDQALATYEAGSKVDLALECDILKFRADCWSGMEDYEHVLIDTNRILALENEEIGTQRHFFHTGHAADEHVQELRRRAFAGRQEIRGLKEEPLTFFDAPMASRKQPSLADLD